VNRRASHNKAPIVEIQKSISPFLSDPTYSVKQRYYTNSGATDPQSFTLELPIVPWAMSTNTTTLRPPFKSVRLARIKIWCSYRPTVGIEGNTVNVTIIERRGVRPIEWSSTASNQTDALIDKKFGADDQLGWFYAQSTGETNPEIMFAMPKGALLELTFTFIMDDNDTINSVSSSGLTADRIYTNSLHSTVSAVGKSLMVPIVV